eukprot:TRINITY_DN32676_c0_g1_i1.p1 TRINITY_DN32676_c0_g1~~TRINITY_DN32676_c0_g1_i1.p1  ORF type:complete len:202 (+),score=13.55 TRINITY_DN32676_c0_g1_i1:33-638(+)
MGRAGHQSERGSRSRSRSSRWRTSECDTEKHGEIPTSVDDSTSASPHEFLLKMGADKLPHGEGRTLYQHLCGTQDLLAQARRPVHEQLAGLFHSIYGTRPYTRTRGLVTREEVVKTIGFRAETLVFLFCTLRHRTADILDCIFDTETNESLLWLEYCNHLDMDLDEFGRPDHPDLEHLARKMVTKPDLNKLTSGRRSSGPQ